MRLFYRQCPAFPLSLPYLRLLSSCTVVFHQAIQFPQVPCSFNLSDKARHVKLFSGHVVVSNLTAVTLTGVEPATISLKGRQVIPLRPNNAMWRILDPTEVVLQADDPRFPRHQAKLPTLRDPYGVRTRNLHLERVVQLPVVLTDQIPSFSRRGRV